MRISDWSSDVCSSDLNGYAVTVNPTHDLVTMGREAGMADDVQGCHLTFIDGYVVSGHFPVTTVNRLLSERPAIKGVTLPGRPMGSPGRTGRKTPPSRIYEIGAGAPKVIAVKRNKGAGRASRRSEEHT